MGKIQDLKSESFAEVRAPNFRVFDKLGGQPALEYPPLGHDVGSVRDPERLPNVVIGDEDPDTVAFQVKNDFADVVDRERVYPGERFVEEDELRLRR